MIECNICHRFFKNERGLKLHTSKTHQNISHQHNHPIPTPPQQPTINTTTNNNIPQNIIDKIPPSILENFPLDFNCLNNVPPNLNQADLINPGPPPEGPIQITCPEDFYNIPGMAGVNLPFDINAMLVKNDIDITIERLPPDPNKPNNRTQNINVNIRPKKKKPTREMISQNSALLKNYLMEILLEQLMKKLKEPPKKDFTYYFDKIPLEAQVKIAKLLKPKDLLHIYLAFGISIFDKKFNFLWARINERKLLHKRMLIFHSHGISWIKYSNGLCFDCIKPTTNINHFYQIPLCENCVEKFHPVIDEKTAHTDYMLPPSSLIGYDFYIDNDTKYYLKKDILVAADELYGELNEKLNPKIHKEEDLPNRMIYLRINKLKDTLKKNNLRLKYIDVEAGFYYINYARFSLEETLDKIKDMDYRKKQLLQALDKYKLNYRTDNILYKKYINAELDPKKYTVDKIAKEAADKYWIYNYTPYFLILNKELKNNMNNLQNMHIYADEIFKLIVNELGEIPQVYPWMEEE